MKVILVAMLMPVMLLAEEDAALLKAREQYQKELAVVVEPVQKRYADFLKVLQDRYTREGKLEAALAAQNERKSIADDSKEPVQVKSGTPKTAKELTVYLENTRWGWEPGIPVAFLKNGVFAAEWAKGKSTWHANKDLSITIEFNGNRKHLVTFNSEFTSLSCLGGGDGFRSGKLLERIQERASVKSVAP